MLALILKMGEEKNIVETSGNDIKGLLATLRESTIIDSEGAEWIIDPNATLYFEAYPPHFEIECKQPD